MKNFKKWDMKTFRISLLLSTIKETLMSLLIKQTTCITV